MTIDDRPCDKCGADTGVIFSFSATNTVYCATCVLDEIEKMQQNIKLLTNELIEVRESEQSWKHAGKYVQSLLNKTRKELETLQHEYNCEVETATALGGYLDQATTELTSIRTALAEAFDLTPDYPDFQNPEYLKNFIVGRLNMYRSIIDEKAVTIQLWEENFKQRIACFWDEWIPCSEKMPEPGQCVLMWIQPNTYIPGNAKEGAYMPMVNPHWPWRSTWDMATYNPEDITHWLPMPKPPEVDGGEGKQPSRRAVTS